jgi:hypothetical protein
MEKVKVWSECRAFLGNIDVFVDLEQAISETLAEDNLSTCAKGTIA